MQFFDLHCHMLCGVDDGAKNEEEMKAMLKMAYEDGTRAICFTPHHAPHMFSENTAESQKVFEQVKAYAKTAYPDLHLFLGHELGYYSSCTNALNSGACRTLGGSRYLLVDFPEQVSFFEIRKAMDALQRLGYHPVLAHTERYRCLFTHMDWVREFVEEGGLVQVNATSAIGAWGQIAKIQWKRLVKGGLAHVVASDGHNLTTRKPVLSVCLPLLQKYCTKEQIRDLTWNNACKIIRNENF